MQGRSSSVDEPRAPSPPAFSAFDRAGSVTPEPAHDSPRSKPLSARSHQAQRDLSLPFQGSSGSRRLSTLLTKMRRPKLSLQFTDRRSSTSLTPSNTSPYQTRYNSTPPASSPKLQSPNKPRPSPIRTSSSPLPRHNSPYGQSSRVPPPPSPPPPAPVFRKPSRTKTTVKPRPVSWSAAYTMAQPTSSPTAASDGHAYRYEMAIAPGADSPRGDRVIPGQASQGENGNGERYVLCFPHHLIQEFQRCTDPVRRGVGTAELLAL
jgi:hypothetical protein